MPMIESTKIALAFFIGGLCLALIGIIIVPTGAATLCARYEYKVAGVRNDCFRCSSNDARCVCGGLQGSKFACACTTGECYEKYNGGSIAMIVIGVFLLVGAAAVLIWLFVWNKLAIMGALKRGGEE